MINKAWLTCDTTSKGDETYTPYYAVKPILKYLKPNSKIWCPFDKEWSAFVVSLKENGHDVYFSHIEDGGDFFNFEKEFVQKFDYIISNPPYSIKDQVLEKLYFYDVSFLMLMPVPSLQSAKRVSLFKKYGLELIIFDKRVNYHQNNDLVNVKKGNHFGSMYFCYKALKNSINFETLKVFEKPLLIVE